MTPHSAKTPAALIVLRHIAERGADLRQVSEAFRQTAIDLAMAEPPLVDIDADRLFVTPAGEAELARN